MDNKKIRSIFLPLGILLLILLLIPIAAMSSTPEETLVRTLEQQTGGSVRISYHAETGKVRFIGTDPVYPIVMPAGTVSSSDPEVTGRQFLAEYGSLFGLADQASELTVMDKQTDEQGRAFVRFQQVYQAAGAPPVPVMGAELAIQADPLGQIVSASGEIVPDISLDPKPKIDQTAAIKTALESVAKVYARNIGDLEASEPALWIYNPAILGGPGLQINALVWRIEVTDKNFITIRELVLVDANLGVVALQFNEIDTAKYRKIYDNQNNSGYGLPGPNLMRTEGQPATGNNDVDKAYDYGGLTYDFYKTNHNRDSLDGAGMQLISTVRYCNPNYTCPYANAYWSGTQMVYGQGYAAGLDVVGHEMTHGVTDHTSRLFYQMQSGAVNESLSDIWGEFIDRTADPTDQWLMGEDLPGGAIRSMSNPTLYQQPDKMSSSYYYCGADDGGGVHTNSGVGNKAAYLMVAGGTFNGRTITPLHGGIPEVAKIFYEVQTHMLTSASDYADLYDGLIQSCSSLISSGVTTPADCQQVQNALLAVEMDQQPSNCAAPEAPICPANTSPVNLFYDNLENPATGNWSHSALIGSDQWYYPQNPNPFDFDATYATSGQNNIWGYDVESRADYVFRLTKNIPLPSGVNVYMHFNSAYSFDSSGSSYYDGGVLEYSTDSGSTWTDAGALFLNNGYNGTIASAYSNPLGGRQGFVGLSHGYISTRLKLNTLGGQNFRFRFRIGTDSSQWGYGWFIDDIRVYTCTDVQRGLLPLILRGQGTATPTPKGAKTSTPTRTVTATRTPTPTATNQGWLTIVNTDFEGDFPGAWNVSDNGQYSGEYYWKARSCQHFAGNYSGWAVGGGANGDGLACGSNYPDNAESWMTFGAFSLANATSAEMNYKVWFNAESGYDRICAMASIDDQHYYGWCYTGSSSGWVDRSLDLSNVYVIGNLLGKPQVWVAFIFSSDVSTTYTEGAFVDNIVLRKCTMTSCGGQLATDAETAGAQFIESEDMAIKQR